MSKIKCITNFKGGVGKTTTALIYGQEMANKGFNILFVDLDPQGNLTHQYVERIESGIFNLLNQEDDDIHNFISSTKNNNIDLIGSSIYMQKIANILLLKAGEINISMILKNYLDQVKDEYDYIIIDTPPSLNILTTNGLVASNSCIIPIGADIYSIEGIQMLIDKINAVKINFNPDLKIEGIFLNNYQNSKINTAVIEYFEKNYQKIFLKTKINNAVEIKEATVNSNNELINNKFRNKKIKDQFKSLVNELEAKNDTSRL